MDNNVANKNMRIKIIDFFKGVAIVGVIIQHIFLNTSVQNVLLLPFTFNLAVPIFIIISGFTFSLSTKNHNGSFSVYLKNYFSLKNLFKKVKRIYIPFVILYLIEILYVTVNGEKYSILYLGKQFLLGGFIAPGNYYIPVLIQIIIAFPFIYLLYNKFKKYSFVIVATVQIIYELAINCLDVPENITRYLAVRYLFFLLCGIYLFYNYKNKPKKSICIPSAIIGIGWIITVSYLGFESKYLFATWTTTALPTAFYLLPLMWFMFYKFYNKQTKKLNLVYSLGEASYHIYLIQMAYFLIVGNRFENNFLNTIVALIVCLATGYLFYIFEKKALKLINRKTR